PPNSFVFFSLRTLLEKHPGWGYPSTCERLEPANPHQSLRSPLFRSLGTSGNSIAFRDYDRLRRVKMKLKNGASLLAVASLVIAMAAGATGARAQAQSSTNEAWLHVRVESHEGKGGNVRVNMPISLAEAIIPAIHNDKLDN